MASSSKDAVEKKTHDGDYICQKCIEISVKYMKTLLKRFFNKLYENLEKESVKLGHSKNIRMFSIEDVLESSQTECSEIDEQLEVKTGLVRQIKHLPSSGSMVPIKKDDMKLSNQSEICLFIHQINYLDLESINRLVMYILHNINADNEIYSKKFTCSKSKVHLVFDDIILYNDEIIHNKQRTKPIGLKIKCKLYSSNYFTQNHPISRFEKNLSSIYDYIVWSFNDKVNQIGVVSSKSEMKIESFFNDVSLLFSELYDEEEHELHAYRHYVVKSLIPFIKQNATIEMPETVKKIAHPCELVIAVEHYNNLYLNDFINRYIDLFNHSDPTKEISKWKMLFFAYEQNVSHETESNYYFFIGFCFYNNPTIVSPSDTSKKRVVTSGAQASSSEKRKRL